VAGRRRRPSPVHARRRCLRRRAAPGDRRRGTRGVRRPSSRSGRRDIRRLAADLRARRHDPHGRRLLGHARSSRCDRRIEGRQRRRRRRRRDDGDERHARAARPERSPRHSPCLGRGGLRRPARPAPGAADIRAGARAAACDVSAAGRGAGGGRPRRPEPAAVPASCADPGGSGADGTPCGAGGSGRGRSGTVHGDSGGIPGGDTIAGARRRTVGFSSADRRRDPARRGRAGSPDGPAHYGSGGGAGACAPAPGRRYPDRRLWRRRQGRRGGAGGLRGARAEWRRHIPTFDRDTGRRDNCRDVATLDVAGPCVVTDRHRDSAYDRERGC
jgi:hypothetical protein